MKHFVFILILFIICFLYIQNKNSMKNVDDQALIRNDNFSVTKIIKRVETDYTQGVFFGENGKFLIESGGLYGESVVVKMEYPSLKVLKKINLDPSYFAEGIARCGQFVYQLTWKERKILKYTYPDLTYVDAFEMDSIVKEGWGLSSTNKPDELIASDGSTYIYFLDCNDNLKVKRKIQVTNNNFAVDRINALAFAKGEIWANRYFDTNIYRINPADGKVVKKYEMSALVDYEMNNLTLSQSSFSSGDVLNGIAYDSTNDKFLLTGKRWGFYYETNFK